MWGNAKYTENDCNRVVGWVLLSVSSLIYHLISKLTHGCFRDTGDVKHQSRKCNGKEESFTSEAWVDIGAEVCIEWLPIAGWLKTINSALHTLSRLNLLGFYVIDQYGSLEMWGERKSTLCFQLILCMVEREATAARLSGDQQKLTWKTATTLTNSELWEINHQFHLLTLSLCLLFSTLVFLCKAFLPYVQGLQQEPLCLFAVPDDEIPWVMWSAGKTLWNMFHLSSRTTSHHSLPFRQVLRWVPRCYRRHSACCNLYCNQLTFCACQLTSSVFIMQSCQSRLLT